ncbi:MAG: fibronectin type III domain-containing protein, partial [Nitriliruptoraceae bacterium]
RTAFGRPLAQQGVVREKISRARLAIDQSRLLVLRTAWEIDTKGARAAATGVATVTAPATPRLEPDTADQDPGDFVIGGFAADATLLVSIGFVDPPAGTTFALPTTTGLTAGAGYTLGGAKTQLSFTATQADANAALAAMTVTTGTTAGEVTIRVAASEQRAGVYYNPINGHYYEYVADTTYAYSSADPANSALDLADESELFGVRGYLATITSAQEQAFVFENIAANNIWIGASDDVQLLNAVLGAGTYADQVAAEGSWHWVAGPEAGTRFWQGRTSTGVWIDASTGANLVRSTANEASARYENWCPTNQLAGAFELRYREAMGEPNDAGGEHYALEKWGGAACWNDYGRDGFNAQSGYLVEYSENWGSGEDRRGSFAGGGTATATVTADISYAPRAVEATAGDAQARITWTAPAAGTVASYTATASPQVDGATRTCTAAADATACTVTGLANGVAYTFTVTATFSDGTPAGTSDATSAVTTAASAPTLTGPATAATTAGSAGVLGDFTAAVPTSCGWDALTATTTTPGGTLTATAAGSATVSGTRTATLTVTGSLADGEATLDAVRLTASAAGTTTVTTTLVPAATLEVDGATYHIDPDTGRVYTLVTTARSRADAAAHARTLDVCGSRGYPVAIGDAAEQAFLTRTALARAAALDAPMSIWTSGEKVDGSWVWRPGDAAPDADASRAFFEQGTTPGTAPWQSGEPNGSGAYHHLWLTGGAYGWDDVSSAGTEQWSLVEFGSTTAFTPATVTTTVTVAAPPPPPAPAPEPEPEPEPAPEPVVEEPVEEAPAPLEEEIEEEPEPVAPAPTPAPAPAADPAPAPAPAPEPVVDVAAAVAEILEVLPEPAPPAPRPLAYVPPFTPVPQVELDALAAEAARAAAARAAGDEEAAVREEVAFADRLARYLTPGSLADALLDDAAEDLERLRAAGASPEAIARAEARLLAVKRAMAQPGAVDLARIAAAEARFAALQGDSTASASELREARAELAEARAAATSSLLTLLGGADPRLPVLVGTGTPTVAPATAAVVGDGQQRSAEVVAVGEDGVGVAADGLALELRAERVPESLAIVLAQERDALIRGGGFAPGTEVSVWLFSTPSRLEVVEVGPDGAFPAVVAVPSPAAIGDHTVQIAGITAGGDVRALALGASVVPTGEPASPGLSAAAAAAAA